MKIFLLPVICISLVSCVTNSTIVEEPPLKLKSTSFEPVSIPQSLIEVPDPMESNVITIAWDSNPEPTVLEYHIYEFKDGIYNKIKTVPREYNTNTQKTQVTLGLSNVLAVTASDSNGLESPYSENLKVKTLVIQRSENLKDWSVMQHIPFVADKEKEFYRIKYSIN